MSDWQGISLSCFNGAGSCPKLTRRAKIGGFGIGAAGDDGKVGIVDFYDAEVLV